MSRQYSTGIDVSQSSSQFQPQAWDTSAAQPQLTEEPTGPGLALDELIRKGRKATPYADVAAGAADTGPTSAVLTASQGEGATAGGSGPTQPPQPSSQGGGGPVGAIQKGLNVLQQTKGVYDQFGGVAPQQFRFEDPQARTTYEAQRAGERTGEAPGSIGGQAAQSGTTGGGTGGPMPERVSDAQIWGDQGTGSQMGELSQTLGQAGAGLGALGGIYNLTQSNAPDAVKALQAGQTATQAAQALGAGGSWAPVAGAALGAASNIYGDASSNMSTGDKAAASAVDTANAALNYFGLGLPGLADTLIQAFGGPSWQKVSHDFLGIGPSKEWGTFGGRVGQGMKTAGEGWQQGVKGIEAAQDEASLRQALEQYNALENIQGQTGRPETFGQSPYGQYATVGQYDWPGGKIHGQNFPSSGGNFAAMDQAMADILGGKQEQFAQAKTAAADKQTGEPGTKGGRRSKEDEQVARGGVA